MTRRQPRIIVREKKMEETDGIAHISKLMIDIDPRLSPGARLDTLIHESLHIAFPWLNEETVTSAATAIAGVLWRDGYRRQTK